ncbi:MAG: glycosyl hydrolase, partial [Acidobacteria bacterium]|nr:glycosyl hydrolase [Acidobacteriota bacterium]
SSNPANPQKGDPPASTEFWTNVVRQGADRYRGRVRYWQLWNEPNVREFWNGSMVQYRRDILEAGARALKETNPEAQVVAPGLANLGNWRAWFRESMGAKAVIDVISHHNYADSGRDAILELGQDLILRPSLRTLMSEAGVDDRPFWLTETGRRTDEGDQLQYYQEAVATLREESWVARLFFFHYWDGPGQGNGGFGIVNEDFSPKPAYRFLQSVLRPARAARATGRG